MPPHDPAAPGRLIAVLDVDGAVVLLAVWTVVMGTAPRAAGLERAGEDRYRQFWVRVANP